MTTQTERTGSRPTLTLLKTVAFVLGSVLLFIAIAMAISAVVSALYSEFETAMWISISAAITALFG